MTSCPLPPATSQRPPEGCPLAAESHGRLDRDKGRRRVIRDNTTCHCTVTILSYVCTVKKFKAPFTEQDLTQSLVFCQFYNVYSSFNDILMMAF